MKMRKRVIVEYVIIGLIVLAAIVCALIYFGQGVRNQMSVAGDAMVGNTEACESRASSARETSSDKGSLSAMKFKCRGADNGDEASVVRDSTVSPVPIPDDGGPTPSEEFKK